MNRTLSWILGIAGALAIGAALVWGGIVIGRTLALRQGDAPSPAAYGMMGGGMGMMGGGVVGGYSAGAPLGAEPLSIEEAAAAVQGYLATQGNDDLELGEIMIFDNHAYAEVVERSTGMGAMELLIDPVTRAVYPEHGPNMMWNLKYSPMGRFGMMGGGFGPASGAEPLAEMPISPEEAAQAAQRYLDTALPGARVDEHADPFYGYYTLHVEREGQIVGMLSVNGYTGQVFPHTWHGEFIEMSEG